MVRIERDLDVMESVKMGHMVRPYGREESEHIYIQEEMDPLLFAALDALAALHLVPSRSQVGGCLGHGVS